MSSSLGLLITVALGLKNSKSYHNQILQNIHTQIQIMLLYVLENLVSVH